VARDRDGHAFDLASIDCPVCGKGPRSVLGRRGGPSHRYGLGVETAIVQCRSCGLLFPDPFPFPRDPQDLYGHPDEYFGSAHDQVKFENTRGIVAEIALRCGIEQPRLLDVGCGRGELVHIARQRGFDAVGTEFSEAMIAAARERYGLTLIRSSLEELARTRPAPFDAVVLSAIIEHVHDPDSLIAGVHAVTHPGSVIYIDTPREPNLLTMLANASSRLRGSRVVYNLSPSWPPYHVFGFNPRALRHLLAKYDMEIVGLRSHAVARVPSRGGRRDRIAALLATQVNHVANLTGTARNMNAWARRRTVA